MNTETTQASENIGRELYDHKNNKYNREHVVVKTADFRASDGANHKYEVLVYANPLSDGVQQGPIATCEVNFQNGGLAEVGPNGITDQALIAIVLDRVRSFNDGPYRCRENSVMITKLEEALMWGRNRADDRSMRGVEGERKA